MTKKSGPRHLPIASEPILRELETSLLADVSAALKDGNAEALTNATSRACERIDETTAKLEAIAPPPEARACGPRCPWCCYVKVNTSPPEVLRIADHLRAHKTSAEQAEILARVAATDASTRGLSKLARAKVSVPCPLLEKDNCAIHEVRPFACRGANSFDANACKRAVTERTPQQIPAYAPQYQVTSIARGAITFGTTAAGKDGRPLELIAALRVALERPNARDRWMNGLPVFSQAVDEEAHEEILARLTR